MREVFCSCAWKSRENSSAERGVTQMWTEKPGKAAAKFLVASYTSHVIVFDHAKECFLWPPNTFLFPV